MSAWSPVRESILHAASVVASFTLLYMLFFAPVLFSGRLLGPGDAFHYYLPNFVRGITFWDPLLMGGFPVAADPQAMTWYPLSILFAALGSWNGFVVSAYVLASCFTYGYVYTLTGSRLAAAVSGTAYGMSGFMMAHLGHTSIVHAAAWMPLLIWALEKLVRSVTMSWFVGGTLAVACSFLSGHAQISVYTLGLGTLYAFVRGWHIPGRVRLCGLYAVIVVLGVGLASLQLIPTAELARLSLRTKMSFSEFVSYSLPLRQSIELFFPFVFGTHYPGDVYFVPYFGEWNLTELTGYMGLLTLMLAFLGVIVAFRRPFACFWIVVGLLAFLLVLGNLTPLAKVMYHLPGANKFRAPARHFIEVTMAVSVLAGVGAAAIKNRTVTAKLAAVVVTALGTTILLSLGVILWRAEALAELAAAKGVTTLPVLPWSNPAVGIPLVVFGLGTAILIVWFRQPASPSRKVLLLVWLVVDLGSFGWFYEWRSAAPHPDLTRPPELARVYRVTLDVTQQRIAPVRGVLGSREEIPPNLNRLWGVPSVSGYGPLLLSRVSEALSMQPHGEITGPWYRLESRALDVMAVSHVVVPLSGLKHLTGVKSQGMSWSDENTTLTLGTECGATQDSATLYLPVSAKTTALGIVSSLSCAPAIPDNTEIVSVVIRDNQGQKYTYGVRAGRDTSEWAFDCPDVLPQMRHKKAPVFLSFPVTRKGAAPCQGHRYVGTLGFGKEIDVKALELTWAGPPAAIGIQKLTLHNDNTGLSYPVSEMEGFLSDSTRWRVDQEVAGTRVYENVRAMPRAWLVPETVTLKPDQVLAALKTSRLPDGRPFDPSRTGLVEEPLELKGHADGTAKAVVQRVTDTVVEVRTRSSAISFLVLSDVFYPGWSVTIDGSPARLYQTNYVLRGVVVPAGEHVITFQFWPGTFYAGLAITVLCSAITMGLPVFGILRKRAKTRVVQEMAHAVEP